MTMGAMSYSSRPPAPAARCRPGSRAVSPTRFSLRLPRGLRVWFPVPVAALVTVLGVAGPARSEPTLPAGAGSVAAQVTSRSARHVRLDTIARAGRTFTAALEGGAHAELTLDPRLQEAAEDVFETFRIPYAAAVVISIPDGRVLALAAHSSASPELGVEELALHPWAPAASVFKVVSAAALIAEGGLTRESRTCYH